MDIPRCGQGPEQQLPVARTAQRRRTAAWARGGLALAVVLLLQLSSPAQAQQQICSWDGKHCNLLINFAVQASRVSTKMMDTLPKDPYIIGGQFIWGCSLNDYAGCLQDAKQGDNSRHCQWDEKNNLCIIDPMHTQKWILEKYVCNKTQIGQFLTCSFMRTADECKFKKGCNIDDLTMPPTGSQVACVPDFWITMPVYKRQSFMSLVNNFRSDLYTDCPLAKLAYQYRQSCFEAEDAVGCKGSSICTWNALYQRCFPSDMAMSVLIWGGDRDDAQTGVSATNMCRDQGGKGECTGLKYTLPKKGAASTSPIRMDSVQSYTGNTNSNPNWGAQVYFPTFTGIPVTMNVDGKPAPSTTITKTAVTAPGATGAAAGALPGAGAVGGNATAATAAKAAALKASDPSNMLNMTLTAAKLTANGTGLSSGFGRSNNQKNGVEVTSALGMLLTALLGALLCLLM